MKFALEGKKTAGRPIIMLLDWMFVNKEQVEISKFEGAGAR